MMEIERRCKNLRDILLIKYWNEKKTQKEIAKELSSSQTAVCLAMKKYGIKTKGRGRTLLINYDYDSLRDFLVTQHWDKKKNLLQIARLLGLKCPYTIYYWFNKKFHIERRKSHARL